MNLEKIDTFLFDLDDTLWRVSKLLPGAKELLKKLRSMDKKVYFVTNNNLMTREELAGKLTRLGISAKKEEVINTSYVASLYMKKRKAKVLVFGKALEKELMRYGISVRKKPPVDYVLIGDDLNFNFNKIALAIQAIQEGAKFVSCNMGRKWHIGDKLVPGVGSLAISIAYATDVQPIVLGKPEEPMLQAVRKVVNNPAKTVMIGDDLVDVLLAKKLKCRSVFIGVKNLKEAKADLVVKSVKELLKFF